MNPSPAPMSDPSQKPDEDSLWGWTRSQRVGVLTLSILVLALGIYRWSTHRVQLPEPLPILQDDFPATPDAVDPNIAPAETLASAGNMGRKVADAIVDYRIAHADGTAPVFSQLSDLRHVPGMTKKLLEAAAPFLRFPTAPKVDE